MHTACQVYLLRARTSVILKMEGKMSRWKLVGWTGVMLLSVFFVGAFWFWLPRRAELARQEHNGGKENNLYKPALTRANFGMLGFRLYETKEGHRNWKIQSEFAEFHRKENYTHMQWVDAEFYAQKSSNVVHTKSQYGRSLMNQERVELEGNVAIRSKRGYLFTMDSLVYLGSTHKFLSNDRVHMKGPNVKRPSMLLNGVGLIGHIDQEHFLVNKNVTASRRLKTSDWLQIRSNSGEFFTEDQRGIFSGHVESRLPNLMMQSDVFEISMLKDKEFLVAKGNVMLTFKEKSGRSHMASIEVGSNRINLEGDAEVHSKKNVIRGKRIILYTDEDRVEVEEAQGRVVQ